MRLALYQPDIPQNTGAMIRLCACLGVSLDVIEPCGFTFTEKSLRRSALDYAPLADVSRHASWHTFQAQSSGRLVLLSTKAVVSHVDFAFAPNDVLLLGREEAGVPDDVHAAVDARIRVPMRADARSLNVAIAAAMVLGEALRQTATFPTAGNPDSMDGNHDR
tara:strand:+ start:747 stop:1235 length:489 start_codon:yes stop_codon:yes gene_type:complete